MLHQYLNKNKEENEQTDMNRMTWSTIRRELKTFLDATWIYGHQIITFRHASLEQVRTFFSIVL